MLGAFGVGTSPEVISFSLLFTDQSALANEEPEYFSLDPSASCGVSSFGSISTKTQVLQDNQVQAQGKKTQFLFKKLTH